MIQTYYLIDVIVPILLGGGLLGAIAKIYKARPEVKEIEKRTDVLGLKSNAEVESISIETMRVALESAQSEVRALRTTLNQERKERQEESADHRRQVRSLETQVASLVRDLGSVQVQLDSMRRTILKGEQ